MKKILFLVLICSIGFLNAQDRSKDTLRYNYVGLAIDSTLFNGKTEYFNNIFNKQYLLDQILIESEETYVKQFNEGFKEGLLNRFDYGDRLLQELGEDGSFDFLKSKINRKGEHHLLFRLSASDGLNYVEFKIDEIEGKPMIIDAYYYMSGEYLSKTLSDVYKASISNKPNLIDKLLKRSLVDDFKKVKQSRLLTQQGKFQEAFTVYNSISSEGKKQKAILLFGMQISSEVSDNEYQKIINRYEELFPNDPSLYLVSMDGAYMSKNYDRVLNLIRKLDIAVGGDPYLHSLRSNTYYAKGDMANAEKYGRLMIDNFPFEAEAYTTLMTIFIEQSKNKEALSVLEEFLKAFGLTKEYLHDSIASDYPEFVKTEDYKNWLNEK